VSKKPSGLHSSAARMAASIRGHGVRKLRQEDARKLGVVNRDLESLKAPLKSISGCVAQLKNCNGVDQRGPEEVAERLSVTRKAISAVLGKSDADLRADAPGLKASLLTDRSWMEEKLKDTWRRTVFAICEDPLARTASAHHLGLGSPVVKARSQLEAIKAELERLDIFAAKDLSMRVAAVRQAATDLEQAAREAGLEDVSRLVARVSNGASLADLTDAEIAELRTRGLAARVFLRLTGAVTAPSGGFASPLRGGRN
jgi:hypothetical protein